MPITVREVLPLEHDAVAALTARVYVGEGYSGAAYEPFLRDVAGRAASATVLVAVEAGAGGEGLVGAVTVATRGGAWAEQAAPGEAVIRMLVVAPEARGRGTAELLVRACLDRARADRCLLVRLSSQHEMATAHRLYERLGFVRTPSFDWRPRPDLELLTYALPLVAYCDQCGEPLTPEGHGRCRAARALEPPRYCPACRRRMVVQVVPSGWTARCVEHGERRAS